ncbi:MAG: U32 family peptidase [Nanoarchaeota archaeon]|nr:U32 family peptidase [Nanoarchaeota archaeon]MBU1621968.1 U32 family peptidase [Nanoarchaeota archaeon]MBU1974602.1 U32 family peptidase [Nanoarchaeota archaeon]
MELLAPVGNRSMLTAAIKAGCDAVYFGIQGMNMRAAANNFSLEELNEVVQYCHQHNVKAFCTVNVIIFEQELTKLKELLQKLKEVQIDAVICWDFAVINLCEQLNLPIHLSTQASISNSAAIITLKNKFKNIERVILARESSLDNIKNIKEKTGLEIECFVHGARCISYSGRCFMSQELFNKSANRGACLQPCRREYKVIDEENNELIMNNNFIMSAKDLCALPLLEKLQFVDCIKIEGRNRGADYVYTVVSVYRKAIEAIKENTFNQEFIDKLTAKLKTVYNKDFSTGFFVDYPYHQRADTYGSKATKQKVQLGKVSNYYPKIEVAEFKVETESFSIGDKIIFIGPTTGYVETTVEEIHTDHGNVKAAEKSTTISIKVPEKVRENDKVYLVKERTN